MQKPPDASVSQRRLRKHARILRSSTISGGLTAHHTALASSGCPELIPRVSGLLLESKWAMDHIRWMMKKDKLDQDMYLLGTHSPIRRRLAFKFCELAQRECEYVALTADTCEADLKSRRELRRSNSVDKSSLLSVVWSDQAVVRAAIHGRVLILEGLEKAERNVLPIINNLLENREMALEDGRFLMATKRFDELEKAGMLNTKAMVRVAPNFRVIALGVPAPPFPGNPLDPPLRSRFQARHVGRVPTDVMVSAVKLEAPSVAGDKLMQLLSIYEAIWTLGDQRGSASGTENRNMAYNSLCYPCEQSVLSASRLLELVPSSTVNDAVTRIFPYSPESGMLEGEAQAQVLSMIEAASLQMSEHGDPALIEAKKFHSRGDYENGNGGVALRFQMSSKDNEVIKIHCCGSFAAEAPPPGVLLPHQSVVLSRMLQSAAIPGCDVCLVGARGEGKSFVAKWFARSLGYVKLETLFLFEDMTSRDLFNRRSTNELGESVWLPTPLTYAMRFGRLCILDGLHRLSPGTISALVSLLQDREVSLNDGTRFVTPERWSFMTEKLGISPSHLEASKIHMVHPGFRIVALAVPRGSRDRRWLSNEIMQLFHFFVMPLALTSIETNSHLVPHILATVPSCPRAIAEKLVKVRNLLFSAACDKSSPLWVGSDDIAQQQYKNIRTVEDTYVLPNTIPDALAASSNEVKTTGGQSDVNYVHKYLPAGVHATTLSLRQIFRAARRAAASPERTDLDLDIGGTLDASLMTEFMPRAEGVAVRSILRQAGFKLEAKAIRIGDAQHITIVEAEPFTPSTSQSPNIECRTVHVGDISSQVFKPGDPSLVPDTLFYEIPQHKLVLRNMLRDMNAGEHMLLMGNQGVGKNKLTDKLLMLLHREREYVQLHRDTTVGSLTLLPSLRNGVVIFENSPLVKAMTHGRVLVIDEFDKAPTEVVVVLKALLEDGEILLADGRRFVQAGHSLLEQTKHDLQSSGVHKIDPDFLVIALANRPGFPFMGNDFFREMGDAFAAHAVSNPDQQSEIALLQKYAPNLPAKLLRMLTGAFADLRAAVEAGKLNYPYSTRELVNIVRHLTLFPEDSIGTVLENVFAFDAYDSQLRAFLFGVFRRHGIPLRLDGAQSEGNANAKIAQSNLAISKSLGAPMLVSTLERSKTCSMSQSRKTIVTRDHCSSAAVNLRPISVQVSSADPYYFVKSKNNGISSSSMTWRGISPEDAEDQTGVNVSQTRGVSGAEWTRLEWHSARSVNFTEEDFWYRIGCVTKEGVLIEGTDPQQGAWLGNMIGVGAAQGCLCVLSTMMVLYVADISGKRCRKLPISVGPKGLENRAVYAGGDFALLCLPDLPLTVFDTKNHALIFVWPRDGIVSAVSLVPPSSHLSSLPMSIRCAGTLASSPVAIYFATGGREMVLCNLAGMKQKSSDSGVDILRVNLPSNLFGSTGGIIDITPLDERTVMIRSDISKSVELQFDVAPFWPHNSKLSSNLQPKYTLRYFSLSGDQVHMNWLSTVDDMLVHSGTDSLYGAFIGKLSSRDQNRLSVLGYKRPHSAFADMKNILSPTSRQKLSISNEGRNRKDLDMGRHTFEEILSDKPRYLRKKLKQKKTASRASVDMASSNKHMESQVQKVSYWHASSHSLINAFADISSPWMQASPINVAHGTILLEVIDLNSSQIRRILLRKTPGLGNQPGHHGAGTGGDLTGRNLLLTDAQKKRETSNTVRRLGMPACIGMCELDNDDGRLALLFADGHVRILELRPTKLQTGEKLFNLLSGYEEGVEAQVNDTDNLQDPYSVIRNQHQNGHDADRLIRNGSGRGKGTGGKGEGNGRGKGRQSQDAESDRDRLSSEYTASEALRSAREIVAKTSSGARAKLDMDEMEEDTYEELYASVENEISQLRVILEAVEAKERERVWLRGKTSGEMDDSRLADLAIGEKNVYKKRGKKEESSLVQRLPKRLSFVVDVSGSMAYFNSDLRLDRLCATVVMLMEALSGLEHKYVYEITGHSGETHHLPFVSFGLPPRNRRERLAVVNAMVRHAAECTSGDNTLAAGSRAIRDVKREDADDFFVFLFSDANLEGYGVSAENLALALTSDPSVNAYAIFIAEPGVATEMADRMPAGRSHVVMENDAMPLLLKDIFARALLSTHSRL